MSRSLALLFITIFWAAVYLPGLGSTELKGEEGRRILPAVTMLETGDWLVPYLGGKPYLRKPPLMNWLLALSFKATGVRNEWTARLPSALTVLALGLTIVGVSGPGWMKPGTALVAAIMATTSFGLLAKARFAGAEIDGVYGALFGIAITLWLAWRAKGVSPWLTWIVPWIPLGLGLLTKVPLHLLFFYGIAIPLLWRTKSMWSLLHPAHIIGVLLMLGIFAAWAVPYFQTEAAERAGKVWADQIANRVVEDKSDWSDYAANLPRGLADLLPWLALAPLTVIALKHERRARAGTSLDGGVDANDAQAQHAVLVSTVLLASALMLVGLLLIPGILPRYVMPLGIPMALSVAFLLCEIREPSERSLVGWHRVNQVAIGLIVLAALIAPVAAAAIVSEAGKGQELVQGFRWIEAIPAAIASIVTFGIAGLLWSRRPSGLNTRLVVYGSAVVLAAASLIYGTVVPKWAARADDLRPLAADIDKSLPSAAELIIYDPGYQPALFYLHCRHRYAPFAEDVPAGAEYVLVRVRDAEKFARKRPEFVQTFTFKRKDKPEMALFQPKAS